MTATSATRVPLSAHNRFGCADANESSSASQDKQKTRTIASDGSDAPRPLVEERDIPPYVASEGSAGSDRPSTTTSTTDIFRRKSAWLDYDADSDLDEMWTLKRASPVFDEDDDELARMFASPSKRQRKHTQLGPEERLEKDDELFYSSSREINLFERE